MVPILLAIPAVQDLFKLGLQVKWPPHDKGARKIPEEKRLFIETKIEEIGGLLGLQKKIEFIEGTVTGTAFGSPSLNTRLVICLAPPFCDLLTDEEIAFVLAHEAAHLANDDILKVATVSLFDSVAALVSYVALSFLIPSFNPIFAVPCVILPFIGRAVYSQKREGAADQRAAEIVGIKGAISFMEKGISRKANSWSLRIAHFFDWAHPSLEKRREALLRRHANPEALSLLA